ncbi:MAG TPA: glycosyltransferase family 4 protein [Candidatus Gastranaerophilales bacterium]|nr:glycosyltransferase family 4 protein [Candidatus Gastranaerophilales bacterium]
MKILQVAPLWEDVPPKTYGGTELIVHILCNELTKRGHDVTLIASKSSETPVKTISPIEKNLRSMNSEMPALYESMSAAMAIEISDKFDIIHNHCGLSMLPYHKILKAPMLSTLHGAFILKEEIEIYNKYKNLPFVSISDSQRNGNKNLNYISTVYNGIMVNNFEFQAKPDINDPYLAYLGRISPEKGTHHAIKLAKETGWKLIIAAKIDKTDFEYFKNQIKPLIDDKRIIFIGEIGHQAKVKLLKNAHALVHAVTWPEPFGLTMAESMACGTPALALNMGSIPEVIKDRVTGYIEENIDDLIKRVKDIDKIDRFACRKHVEDNFSEKRMVENYLENYTKLQSMYN